MSDDFVSAQGKGWTAVGQTHTGLRRSINQDTFVCDPERGLLAVIDGMGGPAAGEVAAAMTRDALLLTDDIRAALVQANGAILRRAVENPDEQGMGCVATAVRLYDAQVHLAHVGDTRAYLASKGGCQQLTRDHTVVAEERERRGMTEEQARALPNQHQVTRDVGGQAIDAEGWVDTGAAAVLSGDVLLLCSDGLHDLVRDGELSQMLLKARSPSVSLSALVEQLLALALERGGHDNITIVLARRDGEQVDDEPTITEARALAPALAPESETQTENTITRDTGDITDLQGGQQRGCVLLGASVGLSVLVAGLGFSLGRVTAPHPGAVAPAVGWADAAATGLPTIAEGPAGLDGTIDGQGVSFTALGPLHAAGWARTEVPDGAAVVLRAADLRFPPDARWQLALGSGAALTLSQGVIRAPGLSWELEVGPGATLIIEDSTVEVSALQVTGASDSVVVFRNTTPVVLMEGGVVDVDGPAVREEER